jgi:hypothetical protein
MMSHVKFDAELNRFVLAGQTTALPHTLVTGGIDYGKPVQETVMGNMAIQEDYSRFIPDKRLPK